MARGLSCVRPPGRRRTNPDGSAAPQSAVTADAMRATSNQFAVVQRKISTLLLNLDAEDD